MFDPPRKTTVHDVQAIRTRLEDAAREAGRLSRMPCDTARIAAALAIIERDVTALIEREVLSRWGGSQK